MDVERAFAAHRALGSAIDVSRAAGWNGKELAACDRELWPLQLRLFWETAERLMRETLNGTD